MSTTVSSSRPGNPQPGNAGKDAAAATVSAKPMAMVAAIGSDISEPGLVPRALQALDEGGVELIAIQHQIRNVDVQFIVDRKHFEQSVRVLHGALVERAARALSGRAAA